MLRLDGLLTDKRTMGWPSPLVSSEMKCSAVFVIAALRGLRVAAILAVNTTEPLDEIRKNPDLVYELIEDPAVKQGMQNAIQTALDSVL